MAYEHCQHRDCGHPSEVVLVIVRVSLTEGNGGMTLQLALCERHADEVVYVVAPR